MIASNLRIGRIDIIIFQCFVCIFQGLSHNFSTRDFTAATKAATAMGLRSFSCSVLDNNLVDADAVLKKGEEEIACIRHFLGSIQNTEFRTFSHTLRIWRKVSL